MWVSFPVPFSMQFRNYSIDDMSRKQMYILTFNWTNREFHWFRTQADRGEGTINKAIIDGKINDSRFENSSESGLVGGRKRYSTIVRWCWLNARKLTKRSVPTWKITIYTCTSFTACKWMSERPIIIIARTKYSFWHGHCVYTRHSQKAKTMGTYTG